LIAIARLATTTPGAALGPRHPIAFQVLGIAGQNLFPDTAVRVPETRLIGVLDRDGDFLAAFDIGDGTSLDGARDRILDLTLVALKEALAVDRRFVLALQTPVDEI
jgi:hypothetical protein